MRRFQTPLARKFVAASLQYLTVANPIVTAWPFTMGCWAKPSVGTGGRTLLCVGDISATDQYNRLVYDESATIMEAEVRADVTPRESTLAVTFEDGWVHAAAVYSSSTSRTIYVNGLPGAVNTNSVLFQSGLDAFTVGRLERSVPTHYYDGDLALPFIYNIALSATDVLLLAKGNSPLNVRPESLIAFWDWTGAETEFGLRGTYPLVNVGSTPVSRPVFLSQAIQRRRRHVDVPAAGAVVIPPMMHSYRQRRMMV